MAKQQFREFPVLLGDRGMRTVPKIGSTPNALNLPHFHVSSFAQLAANNQAITTAFNNLPVPTVGSGFLDVVDGWQMTGSGSGSHTYNVEEILAENEYDITAGIWLVIGGVTIDLDPVPAKFTGAQISMSAGGLVQFSDVRSVGGVQGFWNGEDDTGWDYPLFEGEVNKNFIGITAGAQTVALMRKEGTDTLFGVNARYWTLDTPGTPGDPDENGEKDTTAYDASWTVKMTGYRMSDERFNEATVVGDSEWPSYDL